MNRRTRVRAAVVAVAVVGLVARVVALGGRPFHWEEARVGYWALRFAESGVYEYRPVTGGPLVYLLDRWTFALLGASDATARLPVALIGGLAPLIALTFRGPLRDGETVALAGVLAAEPLLVYYSRFLRGDVPAAVAGLLVVGALVRFRADDDGRWLSVAALALAVALAASGFAVAYPLVWLGAGLLTLDEARIRGAPDAAARSLSVGLERAVAAATPLARAGLVFLVAAFVLFAPRSAGAAPGLWSPTTWPAVADAAFAGALDRFVGYRVVYRLQPTTPGRHALIPYLAAVVRTLLAVSLVTCVAAAVGFFSERYAASRRRLVSFAGYAVPVGLFVFAVAARSRGPWIAVHILPLAAIPAAVAVARGWRVVRRRAKTTDRAADPARIALAVALVGGAVAVAAAPVAGVYTPPERGSPYVQYAQPADDPEELLPAMRAAIANTNSPTDGVDVVYVGSRFDTSREYDRPPVQAADRRAWGARFPLPWYFERLDAAVTSVPDAGSLPADPAIVVTTPARAGGVAERLGRDYTRVRLQLAVYDRTVVVFLHRS
ncbi:MAG: flippase activity-associated protein Agl23 [Halobaculum sp.]